MVRVWHAFALCKWKCFFSFALSLSLSHSVLVLCIGSNLLFSFTRGCLSIFFCAVFAAKWISYGSAIDVGVTCVFKLIEAYLHR